MVVAMEPIVPAAAVAVATAVLVVVVAAAAVSVVAAPALAAAVVVAAAAAAAGRALGTAATAAAGTASWPGRILREFSLRPPSLPWEARWSLVLCCSPSLVPWTLAVAGNNKIPSCFAVSRLWCVPL